MVFWGILHTSKTGGQLDFDRACVECFFGRLKKVFWILRDDALRLAWYKLEPVVVLCVAMMNFRHRFPGFALSESPPARVS